MKKLIILSVAALAMASCGNKNKSHSGMSTQAYADSLERVVADKDSIINRTFRSLSVIADNDCRIEAYEDRIEARLADRNMTAEERRQLEEDVKAMNRLMERNRDELDKMYSHVKYMDDRRCPVDDAKVAVTNYHRRVAQKQRRVTKVNDKAQTQQNLDIQPINVTLIEVPDIAVPVFQGQTENHTVYYMVGSEDDLRGRNVIGASDVRLVSNNDDMSGFVRADDRHLVSVPTNGHRIEMLTPHPVASYHLVKERNGSGVDQIVITDPDAFWSQSKKLVVAYK